MKQHTKANNVSVLGVTGEIASVVHQISKNVARFSVIPKPVFQPLTNKIEKPKEPVEVILKGNMAQNALSPSFKVGSFISIHGLDLSSKNLGKPCLLYTGYNLTDKILFG